MWSLLSCITRFGRACGSRHLLAYTGTILFRVSARRRVGFTMHILCDSCCRAWCYHKHRKFIVQTAPVQAT